MDVEWTAEETGESDITLVQRMAAGDRGAFSTLFRRHRGAVYRFARQMSGSTDIADDITQDVFLALMQNGSRYQPAGGKLSTYLYGIARHLVRRRLRWERWLRTQNVEPNEDLPADLIAHHAGPDRIERIQKIRAVRIAVLSLPVRYREALVLCELNGLTYEQAARVTRTRVGTIRSRLSRARALLSRKLEHWNPQRVAGTPTNPREVWHESSVT